MAAEVVTLHIVEPGDKRRRGPPPSPPDDGTGAFAVAASDIYLKEALIAELGHNWKFAGGSWFEWDGTRWHKDEKRAAWKISTRVCKNEGALIEKDSLARQVMSRKSVYAAVDLAAADEQVACSMSEFDKDPWLLNTPDGVLNLKTGQLEPHDPQHLMTKIAGAGPLSRGEGEDSAGGCPQWLAYLQSATGGDEHLIHYLQRIAGYCLTGSIEEHCILFFHGPGGTGKTLFLLMIQDLLGDYAINAPMNAFTYTTGERHPTEMARMVGARVVTASEVDEGVRWDEGKLKAISGGDKITAHFMRQDDFTFEPQFKLLLAGNHRPRMRSADDAMRRRMHVIPFRHKPKEVDKQLREKLRKELPGILRWAVQGELERHRLGGLNPPRVVQAATDSYFQDENTLGRWVDERCQTQFAGRTEDQCEPNAWAQTTPLYRDYSEWSQRVREFILPERVFVQKLEGLGFVAARHPRTRHRGFRGIRLRYETADLFPQENGAPEKARANELPLEPPSDPGDDYPR